MRSVPHRVVCLLGLDDGTFPRQTVRDGEDVLARDPWIGERDPRSEDRQLLLDAVCAAGEHLVFTYCGADERTGVTVPPAVPLGEVLDALDRTASVPDGGRVRDAVTVRHPLQPFDVRNFTPGALGAPGPFSFDPDALEGARAAAGPRRAAPRFLPAQLPATAPGDVELADLHALLRHPARGFLRQRLHVATARAGDEPDDALPPELGDLERWAVGDRVLTARLAGVDVPACIDAELRRGLLPPGALGEAEVRGVGTRAEAVVRASAGERALPAEAHDVDVALADGSRLTGTVQVRGDVVLSTTYSRLAARHRLQAWVDLVALTASRPDRPWRAVAVGRDTDGALRSVLGPVDLADAVAAVTELVALHRAGLRGPLPLPLKTGAAYADRRNRSSGVPAARTAAETEWLGRQGRDGWIPGEQADAEHVLVHGLEAPLAVLTADPPADGEAGEGWATDEADRFGRLARRLWGRLLAAERQERR
jgi:exodeoxyribonuclease V gamma subunit